MRRALPDASTDVERPARDALELFEREVQLLLLLLHLLAEDFEPLVRGLHLDARERICRAKISARPAAMWSTPIATSTAKRAK